MQPGSAPRVLDRFLQESQQRVLCPREFQAQSIFTSLVLTKVVHYSLIAYGGRVIFSFNIPSHVLCACADVVLFAHRLIYNHYRRRIQEVAHPGVQRVINFGTLEQN